VGTSGWSYDDWVGPFYPASMPKELHLPFYAEVFGTCEINSSFYRIPFEAATRKWARETPEGFAFSAKIPKAITHDAKLDPELADAPLEQFLRSMQPLEEAGKMDFYLLQLPPKFNKTDHLGNLTSFLRQWNPERKLAVEFRHPSWLMPPDAYTAEGSKVTILEEWQDPAIAQASDAAQETLELLCTHQVTFTIVAEPLLPPVVAVTDPRAAYFRFHGYGKRPWFNYEFQPTEVESWSNQVASILPEVKQVNAYWNNHFSGYAVKNALELLKYLHMDPQHEPKAVDVHRLKQAKGLIPKGQRSLDDLLKAGPKGGKHQ
jgi:uncharacterized protein YecE (DUF72 family)